MTSNGLKRELLKSLLYHNIAESGVTLFFQTHVQNTQSRLSFGMAKD